MVALENDLLSGQGIHKFKISFGLRETHAPGGISGEHDCIFRLDLCQPVLPGPVNIVMPAGEYIHRLVARQRKMQIANYIKCHKRLL